MVKKVWKAGLFLHRFPTRWAGGGLEGEEGAIISSHRWRAANGVGELRSGIATQSITLPLACGRGLHIHPLENHWNGEKEPVCWPESRVNYLWPLLASYSVESGHGKLSIWEVRANADFSSATCGCLRSRYGGHSAEICVTTITLRTYEDYVEETRRCQKIMKEILTLFHKHK